MTLSKKCLKVLKKPINVDELDYFKKASQIVLGNILFILGADEYLERLEGKLRKYLFFYVKLF